MICYVCSANDWSSLKELNLERELAVCKPCGAVAYQVEAQSEAQIKEFYRKAYRPDPTHENVLTTNRKLNYIRIFLKDFLKDKEGLTTADVGCATGYLVSWLRSAGHKSTGSELTLAYRRFAENFYGFPIPEDLEPKHRYDLITLYHVLEHMTEPDKKLQKFRALSAQGGHFMVATPQWLDTLEEASGTPMASFAHLFHKDHINVFTAQAIKNLFSAAGLEVVKEDHLTYGQTYLLKLAASDAVAPIVPEDWQEIVDKIKRTNEAINRFRLKQWRDAVSLWPKFPEAWIKLVFEKHGKEPDAQRDVLEEAYKAVGDNARLVMARAMWHFQREEFDVALEQLRWMADVRPNEDVYFYMGDCLTHLGKLKEAMLWFFKAQELNPQKWTLVMDRMAHNAARLPTWDERAMAEAARELTAGLKPAMADPVMGAV